VTHTTRNEKRQQSATSKRIHIAGWKLRTIFGEVAMDVDSIIQLLWHGNQLKRTARTGWVQRGVPEAENVASHTFGVCYVTWVLATLVEESVNLEKALKMAILHDVAEGLTSDIPAPAWRFLPAGTKREMERGAMQAILDGLPFAPDFTAVWEEYSKSTTYEARLVHDADKIDLFIQAGVYEEQTGNRHLREFWEAPVHFYTPQAQAIYDALRRRQAGG
jgi:putative hydrolases of HD superfamily